MQYFSISILVIVCVVSVMWWFGRRKKAARLKMQEEFPSPSLGSALYETDEYNDDGIIAVRKLGMDEVVIIEEEEIHTQKNDSEYQAENNAQAAEASPSRIKLLYVMAKKGAAFSGYELLQVLLSAGLRFGNMNIFHYYRDSNEKAGTLFNLASATEPGVFDVRNMGACSCVGLTLFMQTSGNEEDDQFRYDLMYKTAEHLAEDLDGVLLDAKKNLLSPIKEKESVALTESYA